MTWFTRPFLLMRGDETTSNNRAASRERKGEIILEPCPLTGLKLAQTHRHMGDELRTAFQGDRRRTGKTILEPCPMAFQTHKGLWVAI